MDKTAESIGRALRADKWDREIEADAKAGKLDFLWKDALREIAQGAARPLNEIVRRPWRPVKKNRVSTNNRRRESTAAAAVKLKSVDDGCDARLGDKA